MVDVLHYFFEEDMNYSTGEQAEAHSETRTRLYRNMYDVEYLYAPKTKKKQNGSFGNNLPADFDPETAPFDDEEAAPQPFSPRAEKPKAYVPPTTVNPSSSKPFGDLLDSPLG